MNDLKDKLNSTISKEIHLGFNLSNSMEAMSGQASAAEILVVGPNVTKVKEYVQELSTRLKNIKEVTTVSDSMEAGKEEYQFIVDKEKAMKNGLTTHQVAMFVNQSIQGQVATKLSTSGVEKDVRLKIQGINNSKKAIENLEMTSPLGTKVALKELGTVVEAQSPATIARDNQQDAVTVYANFENADMGTISSKIQTELDTMVQDLKINENMYSVKLVGGTEMMEDAFSSLTLALILSVVFVYMIMASQFGSLIHPLIILVTLPLAMIGVTGGLILTGKSFSITAFMGIIILVGIVVNNAIVFIDYVNKLIKQNLPVRAALIQAGTTRLRPILMTALTTILGLMPLAVGLGEGTEIQAPMAIAVIGGLLSSTVLTLVVIPVVYSLIESLKGIRKKLKIVMQTLKEVEKEIVTVTAK
ncbi:efflux RND transporter permease subunit [Desulfosporosinus sp. BICA1-9]|uniref:efflux RND transporter permease subunit n=1 Tax=Desulfosporosinus sp. BICA1-9 TaxID=1531958 RepID=UPI0005F12503|nr:efflux RND transporter permease subunit [Desulfosporosinus sp. BICA1-9]